MRKAAHVILIGAALSLAAAPALAGGGYGYGHGYGGKYGGYYGKKYGGYYGGYGRGYYGGYGRGYYGGYGKKGYYKYDPYVVGIGAFLGGLVVGSLLSRPSPPPQPVYATPVYVQPRTCVQDQVYRQLPDGRIQTGTRTRCY